MAGVRQLLFLFALLLFGGTVGALGVLVRGRRMLVGLLRVFVGGIVIALLMMLGGCAVSFRRLVVVLGCFLMFIFRHVAKSFRELDHAGWQQLLKGLTKSAAKRMVAHFAALKAD